MCPPYHSPHFRLPCMHIPIAPGCATRSNERVDCFGDAATEAQKVPFVTPELCLQKGCCYDDMYMREPDVWFYKPPGRTWCFKKKGGGTVLSWLEIVDKETIKCQLIFQFVRSFKLQGHKNRPFEDFQKPKRPNNYTIRHGLSIKIKIRLKISKFLQCCFTFNIKWCPKKSDKLRDCNMNWTMFKMNLLLFLNVLVIVFMIIQKDNCVIYHTFGNES